MIVKKNEVIKRFLIFIGSVEFEIIVINICRLNTLEKSIGLEIYNAVKIKDYRIKSNKYL